MLVSFVGCFVIHFDLVPCSCSEVVFQNLISSLACARWCCSSNLIKDDTDISLLQLKMLLRKHFFPHPAPLWCTIMGILIKTNATIQVLHWLIHRQLREILCQDTRWVSIFQRIARKWFDVDRVDGFIWSLSIQHCANALARTSVCIQQSSKILFINTNVPS